MSGGSFIPNQIAAFAVVGDAQNPYTNRISNIAINGRYNSYWDGSTIAGPAVTNFFNSYISKKKIPIDNDYGQPVSKYTTTGKYLALADGRSARRRPLRMATANRRATTISLSRRTLGKTTPKPRGTDSEQL